VIRRGRQAERFLATILFTDIVGSTDLAARLGDREWRRVVGAHHTIVRRNLRRFGGREIDTAGDGFFAAFDQPAQALRAAEAIVAETSQLGLTLRAGVHTGECEMIGRKVGGIAVHIAARVMAAAEPGQVLVSGTVRDLVAGSGLEFADAGTHALKGVPGEWHLFGLARPAATPTPDSAGGGPAIVLPPADTSQDGRRRLMLAALAVVALMAGILAAAFLGGVIGPQARPSLAPGPDTMVAIDRTSGRIVDVRSVPGGPVAVAMAGDRLWVASLDAGVVSEFAIATGGADRTTGRVGRPTGLAIGAGQIWVSDAFDQTVTMIDASTGEISQTVDKVLARRIAYGFDSAWATDDVTDQVLRLDRQSGDVAQAIDLASGAYPGAIAVGSDSLWVGNVGTSTLSRIDPATSTVMAAAIALRAVPYQLASGSTDVWVAARDADELLRVDAQTNSVSATVAVGDQPVSLAVDGDTVWVGCAGIGEVWHLARDGSTIGTTFVGGVPSDIVVDTDRVFVTVRRT
jgi:YVTN family beta-propeller protein